MKFPFTNWINISHCRIYSANVMLSVVFFSFVLSSCMAPRPHSLRAKNRGVVVEKPEERNLDRKSNGINSDDKIDPQEYIKLLEEAKLLEEKSNQNTDQKPVLKPLNEQIAELERRQSKSEYDITILYNKIDELESKTERHSTLIDNLSFNSEAPSVGSLVENEFNDVKSGEKAEFIIKSDEAIANANINIEEENFDEPNKEETNLIPNNVPNKEIEKLNELSFSLAEAYLEKKDFGKAINKLKEIESRITELEEKGQLNLLLGESHFGLKQYANAINYFVKVLELPEFSKQDKAKMMLAESHIATGEVETAKKVYSDIVNNNPKSIYLPKAKMMMQRL